jgi:enamine deaminase RidA (YjgF/YER057c/UK114 family)
MNPESRFQPIADRRGFISGAVLGTATGLLLSSGVSTSLAQDRGAGASRKALRPAGAPAADVGYSPAILAEGRQLVFISGQGPEDIRADMETQIRQTFDRIGLLLKEAGASFANVVIIRSYWVHLLRDLEIFRKVRREYLVEPYPASTAVGTTELAIPGLELEIEAVAVI